MLSTYCEECLDAHPVDAEHTNPRCWCGHTMASHDNDECQVVDGDDEGCACSGYDRATE